MPQDRKMTITMKDGTIYEIHYALKRKGHPKNELVTESKEKIIDYLAKAHRQDKETVRIDYHQHPHG